MNQLINSISQVETNLNQITQSIKSNQIKSNQIKTHQNKSIEPNHPINQLVEQINQINQINQSNQINQINQINQLNQINQINQINHINQIKSKQHGFAEFPVIPKRVCIEMIPLYLFPQLCCPPWNTFPPRSF